MLTPLFYISCHFPPSLPRSLPCHNGLTLSPSPLPYPKPRVSVGDKPIASPGKGERESDTLLGRTTTDRFVTFCARRSPRRSPHVSWLLLDRRSGAISASIYFCFVNVSASLAPSNEKRRMWQSNAAPRISRQNLEPILLLRADIRLLRPPILYVHMASRSARSDFPLSKWIEARLEVERRGGERGE